MITIIGIVVIAYFLTACSVAYQNIIKFHSIVHASCIHPEVCKVEKSDFWSVYFYVILYSLAWPLRINRKDK